MDCHELSLPSEILGKKAMAQRCCEVLLGLKYWDRNVNVLLKPWFAPEVGIQVVTDMYLLLLVHSICSGDFKAP